jgi:hypothetical protein
MLDETRVKQIMLDANLSEASTMSLRTAERSSMQSTMPLRKETS